MTRTNPKIGAGHYQALALLALAAIFIAQRMQDVSDLTNVFVIVLGAAAVVIHRQNVPLFFLTGFTVLQLFIHIDDAGNHSASRTMRPFDPGALLLAGGMLTFVGSIYRLHGLRIHLTPREPRTFPTTSKTSSTPRVPSTRPESVLTADEIAAFLMTAPIFVLAGQLFWGWMSAPPEVGDIPARDMQVALLIWLTAVGILVAAAFFNYHRAATADPETARLHLQEVAWSELRRDHGRMGRWWAWWRRKTRRRATAATAPSDRPR